MVLGVAEFARIMDVLRAFQAKLELTAFEFFSEAALVKVCEAQGLRRPFATVAPFYALLEFERLADADVDRAMELFEHCVGQGWVVDGTLSQSQQQAQNLWRLRENISDTLSRWTPYKNDLSVKVSQVPGFVAQVDEILRGSHPEWEVIWYGHIGDGNVHLNILKPDDLPRAEFVAQCRDVSRQVFQLIADRRGSISAEHGIGLLKKDFLGFSRSDAEIALMRQIKQLLDPHGIMNPGKLLDMDHEA
jgi:FAD/FMN-containing dehydrogenase